MNINKAQLVWSNDGQVMMTNETAAESKPINPHFLPPQPRKCKHEFYHQKLNLLRCRHCHAFVQLKD